MIICGGKYYKRTHTMYTYIYGICTRVYVNTQMYTKLQFSFTTNMLVEKLLTLIFFLSMKQEFIASKAANETVCFEFYTN